MCPYDKQPHKSRRLGPFASRESLLAGLINLSFMKLFVRTLSIVLHDIMIADVTGVYDSETKPHCRQPHYEWNRTEPIGDVLDDKLCVLESFGTESELRQHCYFGRWLLSRYFLMRNDWYTLTFNLSKPRIDRKS